jgi:hypothetical protein
VEWSGRSPDEGARDGGVDREGVDAGADGSVVQVEVVGVSWVGGGTVDLLQVLEVRVKRPVRVLGHAFVTPVAGVTWSGAATASRGPIT